MRTVWRRGAAQNFAGLAGLACQGRGVARGDEIQGLHLHCRLFLGEDMMYESPFYAGAWVFVRVKCLGGL